MDRFEIDTEPIPDDEKYGGGLDHDYEAARQTDASADTQPENDDESTDTDTDTQPEVPPETPAWIDDSRGLIREELKGSDELSFSETEDRAHASYNIVTLPHESAWFQLLNRHNLSCGKSWTKRDRHATGGEINHFYWTNNDGLHLDVTGDIQDREDCYLSYLKISGPEPRFVEFIEDLLNLAQWIKRELAAPALIEVDADQFDDSDRLIDRERSADVVRRLPAPRGEQ
jgi:hypothetical protein